MNQSWLFLGVESINGALVAMRHCIEDEEDIDKIKKMIEDESSKSRSVNEQALWETYKDFLDPRINKAIASVEGEDGGG